jgi:hypothetical protein
MASSLHDLPPSPMPTGPLAKGQRSDPVTNKTKPSSPTPRAGEGPGRPRRLLGQ